MSPLLLRMLRCWARAHLPDGRSPAGGLPWGVVLTSHTWRPCRQLDNMTLTGTIPPELSALVSLQVL